MLNAQTLAQILLSSGFVAQKDFEQAQKTAEELNKSLADILVFKGLISEDALGKLIAEYYKVPFASLHNRVIPLELLQLVPEQAALSFRVMPFELNANELHLGMENPQDIEAIEFVKRKTNFAVIPHYITESDFSRSIGQYKRNIKAIFADILRENVDKAKLDLDHMEQVAEEVPIIKILDTILEYASAEGASDVHMELMEDNVLLRFRVDGVLRDIALLPKAIQPALVARIKILSGLKLDEHRLPQDGRFKFKIHEAFIALRVSILPAFFGENIVMRLLPESSRPLSLEELGVSSYNLPLLKSNVQKPNGMILVTGPTGSGKTTTLYTVLNLLNSPERKICTIEDPVEYSVRRINQTQVNPKAGLTFAAGLRSLLRHDPDVIMIGEIRDTDTAEIAIHSALTGHLVLSTLHTNSAIGAIPRLIDMGVQGFLLASTLNIVIAQRLVRRVCTNCMVRVEPTQEMKEFVQKNAPSKTSSLTDVFIGQGCDECSHSGYKGRVSIYEMLEISRDIRKLIVDKASEDDILQMAVKQGMSTLITDGIDKVSAGLTTIDEIIRVTTE